MTKLGRTVSLDSGHRTARISLKHQRLFYTTCPDDQKLQPAVLPGTKSQPLRETQINSFLWTARESNKLPPPASKHIQEKRFQKDISASHHRGGSALGCLSPASGPKMIILINWNESCRRRGASNSPADLSPFSTQLGSKRINLACLWLGTRNHATDHDFHIPLTLNYSVWG